MAQGVYYYNETERSKKLMEEQETLKISKSTLYGIIIFFLILGTGFFMIQGSSSQGVSGNAVAVDNNGIQEITVGMKNYNYHPNTVRVKAGTKVRMKLDESVYGCFRDLTLRDFGIREYLATPNDYVEFTPEKPGNYRFACSMGMGYGTLVVE